MTFLAPGFFYASLAVAAAIAALHFIVTRQPRAGILPTARFVPDVPATATARAARPSDLPLLLVRMLLVLAAGAGLAKPVIKPSRTAHARVILADVSRAVTDTGALRDSVRSVYRDGDVIVAFDSAAALVGNLDSLAAIDPSNARGNLSAALVAALRGGSLLRERADSVELVVVSPLAADELDAATDSVRSLWPGRGRVVISGRASATRAETAERLSLRAASGDPLAITVARLSSAPGGTIVRDASASRDGSTIIDWPATARPARAVGRAGRDTIGGIIGNDAIVISAFERRWTYPPDSLHGAAVVARWIDGEAAAIEWLSETGCSRSVGIPVNQAGDLVIRDDFSRLVAELSQPCVGSREFVPPEQNRLEMIQGKGSLAPRAAFEPRGDVRSWLAPWLLGVALLLAVGEMLLRRRRSDTAIDLGAERADMASAA